MHRLVVSFFGLFYSDIRRAYAFVQYGRRGGLWWSSPGEMLIEYVQNCDILDQLGRKTLPTGQFLFLTFVYWNDIEIILKINEGDWILNSWLHTF